MKLEEVLPSFRDGKMIRRKSWEIHWQWIYGGCFELSKSYVRVEDPRTSSRWFNIEDAIADDWEVTEVYRCDPNYTPFVVSGLNKGN